MADAAAVGDSADVLARAIVAQAKEDAEKIRQAAQAEADQIIAEAQGRAVERHAAEGREQTDRIRKEMVTELALARFEARRRLLAAREELIEQTFAELPKALDALKQVPSYVQVLAQLVCEAIDALEGDRFVVMVAPEDMTVAEQALRESEATRGEARKIDIEADSGMRGGCMVWQADRRAYYDNSFASIVGREKPRLRPLVAQWLWGTEESWEVS
ncbi:MAG: V-type ATP synthase subunit E [Candidatus Binataceae bacterium]|jgi:V/A-type H+-transporting ATPase subunit E